VKNSSPISRHRIVEDRTTPRALDAHRVMTAREARSSHAMVVNRVAWASYRGPWPSGPLRPWAVVRPEEIVYFSIFLWIYSNEIQIHFGLNLNLSKFV
jgi:hypothetical protein